MRILVAHNVPCDRPGGMSRMMGFIHERVARAGHRVDYLCAEHAGAAGRGRLARFRYPHLVWRTVRRAARDGAPYAIVNVHEPSSAWIATARGGLEGVAVAVTSYGVEQRAWELALEERRLGRSGPRLKTRLWYPATSLWQSRLGLRRADVVFCANTEDREYLSTRLGIRPERTVRIHPGADSVFATASARRDYGRATRLLFAGTWRKNKGIEDFVPAFVTLARRYPLLQLTVTGAGVPPASVRAAFPDDLRDRVAVQDTTSEDQTAAAFASADVFVLPSLFEGSPLTLAEAMMSGLPIVTTGTCGMKDVVEHERTGLLIPIRAPDAIVAAVADLLEHAADRERLGRAARAAAVERFTWDRVAADVLRTYERLARHAS